MEAYARPPEALPDKQPMDKTWRMWKQEFTIFLKAARLEEASSDAKASLLLNTIGKVGIIAMQDMEFDNPDKDQQNFEILMQKFDDLFDPPKREIEERYKFYTRSKKNNEPIEAYITDLKEKAKSCNFGDLTESLIRDMVILDIKDKHMRKMMFEEKNLDLTKLTLLYKQYELHTEKMKEVSKKTATENVQQVQQQSDASDSKSTKTCWRCGTSHAPRNCPAFHVTCDKCHEKGHFTQKCGNKARGPSNNPNNVNVNKNVSKK